MNRWYRIALFSGLVPLGVGVGVFLLWLATRASWLGSAGLLTLAAGLVLFVLGIVCLAIYLAWRRREGATGSRARAALPLLILLGNVVVAIGLLAAVAYVAETCTLIVENRSSCEIRDMHLTQRDEVYPVGIVDPGGRIAQDFHFKYEGRVDYTLDLDGVTHKGIAFGYVSTFGDTARVTVAEALKIIAE
jgi:hypothetical protein